MYLNCVSLFIGTERARRSTVQKKKKKERGGEKRGRQGWWLSSERSLGARGELLQVMDALLVNQTHGEGGKVQDEALVELEDREETRQRRKR